MGYGAGRIGDFTGFLHDFTMVMGRSMKNMKDDGDVMEIKVTISLRNDDE